MRTFQGSKIIKKKFILFSDQFQSKKFEKTENNPSLFIFFLENIQIFRKIKIIEETLDLLITYVHS